MPWSWTAGWRRRPWRARAAGFGDRFFCAQGCALRLPLPAYDVLVANIPYQISSPVLARLWAARPPPRAAVLLLQREFAERLVALPGGAAYSRLSVNCALLSDSARIVMRVGREQFVPPPRVDSAVIEIVPRPGGAPPGLDFARWDAFLRIAFGGKNKRLRSVLVNKHVLAMLLANKEAGSGGGGADSAAAAAAAMAAPAASEDASSSDDDDDDDSRTVGLAGEDEDEHGEGGAQGAEDWLTTQHGRFPRAALHGVRDSIDAILGRLGALEWRANGMPVDAFRAVFSGLEEAGWRFTPVRLRVFPAAPGADGAAPPADAVR